VTAAAHSGLLAGLMTEIAELIRESRIESLAQPGRPEESLLAHRKVADAIRTGDAEAAATAMAAHIAAVSDTALLRER
jgi:GntR family transcriptional repressor for pyruvate dehydrogenase complex